MPTPPTARTRAQSHFRSSEQRADAVRAEREKERAAVDAKTVRLKALRLEKEAEDQAEADRQAAETAKKPARTAKKSAKAAPEASG